MKTILILVVGGLAMAMVGCADEVYYRDVHHYHHDTAPGYAVPIPDHTTPDNYRVEGGN